MMSALLSSAIQKAETLQEGIQDELAEESIENIESEIKWQETLSKPQESLILKNLAAKAIKESDNGENQEVGFDELCDQN
jgi:hypothetical protein